MITNILIEKTLPKKTPEFLNYAICKRGSRRLKLRDRMKTLTSLYDNISEGRDIS